ncbi:MAG: hypothetical protein J6W71_00135, partial [Methanobrevibacter sp.]|nr:hypothetical protein [Methanobrevibacter sp.]
MARNIVDTKIRTLIKAYLTFNKGKKCTASEIADFVNCNDFGLNQYSLHPTRVSNMINSAKYYRSHILSDIRVEKINGRNH